MSSISTSWPLAAAAALFCCGVAQSQAPEPGDEWKMTMSMEIQGMSMPGQTTTQCLPRSESAAAAPRPQDGNCQLLETKRSGNTVKTKMRCGGPEPMQAEGTFTTTGNTMRGVMTMTGSQGAMQMIYNGTKTGKSCDAGEFKRKLEAGQKAAKPAKTPRP